jgi:putative ABC transport system permease protein
MKFADAQYVPAYDLRLVAGRNIFPGDTAREIVVNEAFVRAIRLRNPSDVLGKHLKLNTANVTWTPTIVGVVKDFHNYSMHSKIDPIVIAPRPEMYRYCSARINISDLRPVLAAYEKIWNDTYPQYVYSSQFLDERIARFYRQDTTTLRLVGIFSGIAILISCLGLYGLVSFMAQQKTKEIGVRKVLGAGVQSILWLFGKEFGRLLLIAFLIAAPVAGWVMARWLQSFEYRIMLTWTIFLTAIASTFGIAMLTVAWRSIRAALANPVNSLRSE